MSTQPNTAATSTWKDDPTEKLVHEVKVSRFEEKIAQANGNKFYVGKADNGAPFQIVLRSKKLEGGETTEIIDIDKVDTSDSALLPKARLISAILKKENGKAIRTSKKLPTDGKAPASYKFYRGQKGAMIVKINLFLGVDSAQAVIRIYEKLAAEGENLVDEGQEDEAGQLSLTADAV